jgi:hypothetical protein
MRTSGSPLLNHKKRPSSPTPAAPVQSTRQSILILSVTLLSIALFCVSLVQQPHDELDARPLGV